MKKCRIVCMYIWIFALWPLIPLQIRVRCKSLLLSVVDCRLPKYVQWLLVVHTYKQTNTQMHLYLTFIAINTQTLLQTDNLHLDIKYMWLVGWLIVLKIFNVFQKHNMTFVSMILGGKSYVFLVSLYKIIFQFKLKSFTIKILLNKYKIK